MGAAEVGRLTGVKLGDWRLGQLLGGGNFGQVYVGRGREGRSDVAVKVEAAGREGLLCTEVRVLRLFSRSAHAAALLGSGRGLAGAVPVRWLAMERLSRSLQDLHRSLGRPLSLPSGLHILYQGVLAVEELHQTGYLHRDLKPGNLMMGREGRRRTVVVVDLGLARRWRRGDGRARRARTSAPFRGSLRYASPAAHLERELGRADDLWSLLYLALELMGARLPWSRVPASPENLQVVGALKQDCSAEELLDGLPEQLGAFREALLGLGPEAGPDYARLRAVPAALLRRLPAQARWDWDAL